MSWTPGSYDLSTGYRKITNLYGGKRGSTELGWMSEWDTTHGPSTEQGVYGPIYARDPKYLWYLDSSSQKLKFSANLQDSLGLNPVKSCYQDKHGHEACSNFNKNESCGDGDMSGQTLEDTRAEWKFIDEQTAVACCSLPANQVSAHEQCTYAFNPTAGGASKCSPVMSDFCTGHWGDSDQIGEQCTAFLNSSPLADNVISDTFINYVTDPARTTTSDGQVWQDYISPQVAANDPTSVAADYYSRYPMGNCSAGDINVKPECRDDSKDPFFTNTVPYLANQGLSTSNVSKGVLDLDLDYFCQEFSRDSLVGSGSGQLDRTLLNMCGCHALGLGRQPIPSSAAPATSSGDNSMWDLRGKPQTTSPYYQNEVQVGGESCDPMCMNSDIQNYGDFGGPCTGTNCVIDNVTVNIIDSETGGINIDQACGNCSADPSGTGGNCSCYISDVTISEMGSDTGAIDMTQQCGTCYVFTDDDIATAQPIECGGGSPYQPDSDLDQPGKTKKAKVHTWAAQHKVFLVAMIVIIALLFGFIIFALWKHFRGQPKVSTFDIPETSGLSLKTASGQEYWDVTSGGAMTY